MRVKLKLCENMKADVKRQDFVTNPFHILPSALYYLMIHICLIYLLVVEC